ncbi:MAG: DUF1573 domain-containing protein [Candidatus Aminicenantales bacterium]
MIEKAKGRTCLVLLSMVSVLLMALMLLAEKGPRIEFKETSFNFGQVEQGRILTHVFKFTNAGDETLVIEKVRSSCGCTAVLVSARKIAPGAKGELKATFNTSGFQGKVSKYVYVESNDPRKRQVTLTISAEIEVPPRPQIQLESYTSDQGVCLEGEEIRAKTVIRNKGELELRVNISHRDAKFYTQGKEVSFPLRIASGESVELEVAIPSRNRKGLVREYVLLRSNDPQRQTVSFYITGYIITRKQLKELFEKYKDILH